MRKSGMFVLVLSQESAVHDALMISEFNMRRRAYRGGKDHFLAENAKVILSSYEWDNDKREIWEIPEARKLFLSVIRMSGLTKCELKDLLHHETTDLLAACAAVEYGSPVTINGIYYYNGNRY